MATIKDLIAQQGPGWSITGPPAPKLDDVGTPIPSVYTITLAGPEGAQRVVTVYQTPQLGPTTAPPLSEFPEDTYLDATVANMGVEETVKPGKPAAETQTAIEAARAQTEAARAQTARDQQALKDLQDDNNKRQGNLQSRGLFMTDKEIADMDARLRDQGLQQSQIDAQLKIASDNNQNSRTANEIAALNAATSARVAEQNARIAEARLTLDGTEAAERHAQNVWTQAQAEIVNAQNQQKIDLDRLTQQQANQIAQGTLGATQQANVLRGQELEQRAAEARQTAENAAISAGAQAAASIANTERVAQQQAATTGANLLQQRAKTFQELANQPFAQAAALSQGSSGRYGMLGGGLHGPLPGGAVENIIMGAYGTSAGLLGGQNTLNAAQQAVEQIRPGSAMSPEGQAAAAVLAQMMDRTKQILSGGGLKTGPAQPQPQSQPQPVPTPAAPEPTPTAAQVTSPQTQPFFGQDIQELMRQQMQQHVQPPQPTISAFETGLGPSTVGMQGNMARLAAMRSPTTINITAG